MPFTRLPPKRFLPTPVQGQARQGQPRAAIRVRPEKNQSRIIVEPEQESVMTPQPALWIFDEFPMTMQVTSPATCKNCLSVGFSGSVNQQYRWIQQLNPSIRGCHPSQQTCIIMRLTAAQQLQMSPFESSLAAANSLLSAHLCAAQHLWAALRLHCRRAATIRDPLNDICGNCSSPHFCSQWVLFGHETFGIYMGSSIPRAMFRFEHTLITQPPHEGQSSRSEYRFEC
jgi:hypothetical protein